MSMSKVVCAAMLLSGTMVGFASAEPFAQLDASQKTSDQSTSSSSSLLASVADDKPAVDNAPSFSSSAVAGALIPAAKPIEKADKPIRPFSKIAVGTRSGTLGFGGQIATPLSRSFNIRGSANFFTFGGSISTDGANYGGNIQLRSGQINLDWFPGHRAFHITPGLLIFKSAVSASYNVVGGKSFDLGTATLTSSTTDPVTGVANINFGRSLMPSLMFGFGNMIARESKHWSTPFEIGAAYMGHNTMRLNLQGSACSNLGCMSTSSATIQQDVVNEQNNLNESMKRFQIYPILTTGVAYRF